MLRARLTRVVAGAMLSLGALGCGEDVANPGTVNVYVLIVGGNFSGTVDLTVNGGGFDKVKTTVSSGGDRRLAASGAVGVEISFDASRPAGSGFVAASGSGSCKAGPTIVGTGEPAYGQVNVNVSGPAIIITCSTGWQ